MQSADDRAQRKTTERIFSRGCLGWGLWLAIIIFFGQNTWASMYENESRAAIIYATFTGLLLFGGIIVYFSRHNSN